MTEWNIHPDAQEEHDELLRYFGSISEELVTTFELLYLEYRHAIVTNPLLYNLRQPPVRRVNLKPRFSEYHIAYMIWREKVVILAVAHAKRRPYYWRDRIDEARRMF